MSKDQLYSEVYTLLEDRFMRGFYLPNEPISDYALSQELQISRNPIRRAMQALQQQGFLSNNRHQSKLVIGYHPEECVQLCEYMFHLLELSLMSMRLPAPLFVQQYDVQLERLKFMSEQQRYYEYLHSLTDLYALIIQQSGNSIWEKSFETWQKPFIRMHMLSYRLGYLHAPYKEIQQFTQLLRLFQDQLLDQAKIYIQCLIAESRAQFSVTT